MKNNIMDILKERGFIKQIVFEEDLYKKLGNESITFYIGYDPTADSLHTGHFLTLMAMSWMQKAGHKPLILVGGGTGMIGDPSGRTDMRSMMTKETIQHNVECFRKQMSKFVSFEGNNAAEFVDNADWLLNLNYVDFLRDVGIYFSVNRMLTADCYKSRLEKGLTFLEFNYMLMQSYDFLHLFKTHNCVLQCGGDDQWSNILSGADLIRRKERQDAFAMTFTLLTTSQGTKMGKTAKGALWLDREKTTPYEFFQYWRNRDDADIEKCLMLLTYLSVAEIKDLCKEGANINIAKERLAFEVTSIVHSKEDAEKSLQEARAAFSGDVENMPTVVISKTIDLVVDLLTELKLAPSKGEAKRLIMGGGISIDDNKITAFDYKLTQENINDGIVVHKGKKIHIKVDFK